MARDSLNVVGVQLADNEWQRYKNCWDACKAVGAKIPEEVAAYFEGCYPNEEDCSEVSIGDALEHYERDKQSSGFVLHVNRLPAKVAQIRIFNTPNPR
jgi:hypothetical protein